MLATNTSFKRMDWQYLLPLSATGKVKHLHYLHNPSQISVAPLHTIAGKVTVGESITTTCDLLIVPHNQPFRKIPLTTTLNEGGILLLEIQRERLSFWQDPPHVMDNFLKEQGLTTINTVWVAPDFQQPKRYIPLQNAPILQWYFQSLFIASSPPSRIAKTLFTRFPQLLQYIVPCYIIVAVKNNGQQNHYLINSTIKEPIANTVVLTSGFDEGSRTIILPFPEKSTQPSAIIKVANTPTLNTYTAQEQQTLTTLQTKLPPSLKNSIPQPLGITTHNGRTVSTESPAQGIPLWTSLQNASTTVQQKFEILRSASQWITQFHQATIKEHLSIEAFLETWITPTIETYKRYFGEKPTTNTVFTQIKAHSHTAEKKLIPLVWQHFDYSPWNIYQDKEHITVIDWEYGRTTQADTYSPPLCDLIYFSKYWLHAIQKTKTLSEELTAFHFLLPNSQIKVECQAILDRYCQVLGVPRTLIPALTVYTWMEQAIHQTERQALQGNTTPTLNKAHHYVEALAEHQHLLLHS